MTNRRSVVRLGVCFLVLLLSAEASRMSMAITAANQLRQSAASLESIVTHLLPVANPNSATNTLQRFSSSPTAAKFVSAVENAPVLLQLVPALLARNPNIASVLVRSHVAELAVNFLQTIDQLAPASSDSLLKQVPTDSSFWGRVAKVSNSEDWNKAMSLALGRPAEELSQVFLEYDQITNMTEYNKNKVQPTKTFVEDIMQYNSQNGWVSGMERNRSLFLGFAVFVLFVLILTIFVVIHTLSDMKRTEQFGIVGCCLMIAWVAMALYMCLTSIELYFVNKMFLDGYAMAAGLVANRNEIFGNIQISNSDASSIVAQLRSQLSNIFTSVSSSLIADSGSDDPVFCTLAFQDGTSDSNKYPSGHPLRDYNLRRIADQNTDRDPILDYAKTLLVSEPYPPPSGGVSNREARMLKAVSNECEEEGGNVTLCCDPTRAVNDAALQMRCPGRVIRDKGDDNHCNCVEAMTKLGFEVEPRMVSRCVAYVKNKLQDVVSGWTGQDVTLSTDRSDIDQVYGCVGTYDASDLVITGNVLQKYYKDEPLHLDRDNYDSRSMYIYPSNTGGVGTATLNLTNCMSGPHVIQFRSSNKPNDKQVTLALSRVPSFAWTKRITGLDARTSNGLRVLTTWGYNDVIAPVSMLAGNQLLRISGGMIGIHKIYVCAGTSAYGCVTDSQ